MKAPTDLELMMYFDGELDEPRLSEVRTFVEGAGPARSKLAGLGLGSELLRESALARAASADDLTDLIMAKVTGSAPAAKERTNVVAIGDAKKSKDAAPLHLGGPKLKEPALTEVTGPLKDSASANENGRVIFGLAAMAAAAAAALFIWGRTPGGPDTPTKQPAQQAEAPADMPAGDSDRLAGAPTSTEAPFQSAPGVDPAGEDEEDAPRSVEVAAVDFGSRPGLIYYVSGEDKPTSTTVVWVRDE